MFDKKFLKFIQIWQEDFGIEQTIKTKKSFDCDGQPLPWYTYPAIEYLSQFDYHDKKVFEFGCANSSLFWAQRALCVTSVEDNPVWYEKWQKELKMPNLHIKYRDKENYHLSILEKKEKFDIIIIDGINRGLCAKTAVQALSREGMIIFDDSDRANKNKECAEAIRILKEQGLFEVDFYGFCPMNIYPKTTSVFFTRNFNFTTIKPCQPACGKGSLWSMPRQQRKKIYRLQQEKNES